MKTFHGGSAYSFGSMVTDEHLSSKDRLNRSGYMQLPSLEHQALSPLSSNDDEAADLRRSLRCHRCSRHITAGALRSVAPILPRTTCAGASAIYDGCRCTERQQQQKQPAQFTAAACQDAPPRSFGTATGSGSRIRLCAYSCRGG
eukprot:gnl/TRDRNA2_/TRDRNA2_139241_c0_seq1.p1 gnl/TRDRNA2_/TRDRNA2_139241_c0~~gnl/TRDRNA2_/TRDRNA2_139241_c0_seq1.p1  ORF type:complete len:145 (-),score=18.55 gnl/TRDRNA2_/TRDRNA2_139241_c0_seq1:82-516(-)